MPFQTNLTADQREVLFAALKQYIDDLYIEDVFEELLPCAPAEAFCEPQERFLKCATFSCEALPLSDLGSLLDETDAGFSETLLQFIARSEKTNVEVYTRAHIDRKLFSKIKNNPNYTPKKGTVLAFAIALELNLDDTLLLLERAGYTLTHASKFDIIVEYFIKRKIYDIILLNEALYEFDQPLLGQE